MPGWLQKILDGFLMGLGFAFAWNIIGWLCMALANVVAHGAGH